MSSVPKITASDVQVAVARLFNWRQHIIIPNVSWGIGLRHEADLVVLSKSGYLKEIEIKVSASDIKADMRKGPRWARVMGDQDAMGYSFHMEGPIRQLFFAVPEHLADNPNIPEKAGIIAVRWEEPYNHLEKHRLGRYAARIIRAASVRKEAIPLKESEIRHLLHMGCMRVWSLKEKIMQMRREPIRNKLPLVRPRRCSP